MLSAPSSPPQPVFPVFLEYWKATSSFPPLQKVSLTSSTHWSLYTEIVPPDGQAGSYTCTLFYCSLDTTYHHAWRQDPGLDGPPVFSRTAILVLWRSTFAYYLPYWSEEHLLYWLLLFLPTFQHQLYIILRLQRLETVQSFHSRETSLFLIQNWRVF